jgi:hypothetical protein
MRVAGLSPHRAETTRIARPFRQLLNMKAIPQEILEEVIVRKFSISI